jgi:hypothetical protein
MADETGASDERPVELAHQMFDLARAGETARMPGWDEQLG